MWRLGLLSVAGILILGCGDDDDQDAVVDPGVEGDYTVELTPGGGVSATLTVSIDQPSVTLDGQSLDITAELIDPGDLAKINRLPAGVFLPSRFPVLIGINPKSDFLSFKGLWSLELVTENLEYSSHSPYRLFKAADGGAFSGITEAIEPGSFRVHGSGGSFSEFVVASDLRPINSVVEQKFTLLIAAFESAKAAISAEVFAELDSRLETARRNYESGADDNAIATLDQFRKFTSRAGGRGIPDIWHVSGNRNNVAGELDGLARTLQFSLGL